MLLNLGFKTTTTTRRHKMSAKNRTADMSGYSVRNLFCSTFEVSSDDWKFYYVRVDEVCRKNVQQRKLPVLGVGE